MTGFSKEREQFLKPLRDRLPSESGVWIVGFYPIPEMDIYNQNLIIARYRALHFSYGCGIQILHDPSEVILPDNVPIIAVQQEGPATVSHTKFVHPHAAVYIVGNSEYPYPSEVFDIRYRTHIETPRTDPLYGDQAAGIILQHRFESHIPLAMIDK